MRHGYWLPQTYNPNIPLTIEDAIKYKVSPEFSIEFKKTDPTYPEAEFQRNVMAQFVPGEEKPITEQMMHALVDKNIGFIASADVDHSLGEVYVGGDWGGGPKTVVWVWQCVNDDAPIFQLLLAAKLDGQNSDEQYQTVRNVIDAYEAKQAVIDAGGATHQVEQLIKYFGPRCIKNVYLQRPARPLPITNAERKKHRKHNMFEIDKTYSLDAIVDLIKIPYYRDGIRSPRIILPGKNFSHIEWIIKQFCNEEVEYVRLGGSGQPYRRYYTPDQKLRPDDALHACNYARLAWLIGRTKGMGHFGGAFGEAPDYDDMNIL